MWVGFDKPQTIAPKGYGAALALPIWVEAMNAAPPQRYPATDLGRRLAAAASRTIADDLGHESGVENLPGNIFRSFQKFLGGH